MDTIGLDLHKRESQLCILGAEGAVQELRIATSRERLSAVLGHRPPARILVEALTENPRTGSKQGTGDAGGYRAVHRLPDRVSAEATAERLRNRQVERLRDDVRSMHGETNLDRVDGCRVAVEKDEALDGY